MKKNFCPGCVSKNIKEIKTRISITNIYTCLNCSASYSYPFINEENLSLNSTSNDEGFIENLKTERGEKRLSIYFSTFQKRLKYWKKYLGKTGQKLKILEIGCSTGLAVECLSKLGQDVTGIDIDEEAISIGKKRSPNLQLYCEDIMKVDNFSNFDIVFSSQVLEHFFEPLEFLKKLRYLIRLSNSLIHLDIPNHESLSSKYYKLFSNSNRYGSIDLPCHQIGYKKKTLRNLFYNLDVKPEKLKVFNCPNNHRIFGQSFDTSYSRLHFIKTSIYYGLSKFTNTGGLLIGIAKF